MLRGSIGSAAAAATGPDLVTDELTERLVVLNVPQHLDLAALNLQRGRDHALPGEGATHKAGVSVAAWFHPLCLHTDTVITANKTLQTSLEQGDDFAQG